MKYVFFSKSNYYEFKSWDGNITSTPATYRWLLGKPVTLAVEWFKGLNHQMDVQPDDTGR